MCGLRRSVSSRYTRYGASFGSAATNLRTFAGSIARISGRTHEVAALNAVASSSGALLHLARARRPDVLVGQAVGVDRQPRQVAVEIEHHLQRRQQLLGRLAEVAPVLRELGQPLRDRSLALVHAASDG